MAGEPLFLLLPGEERLLQASRHGADQLWFPLCSEYMKGRKTSSGERVTATKYQTFRRLNLCRERERFLKYFFFQKKHGDHLSWAMQERVNAILIQY